MGNILCYLFGKPEHIIEMEQHSSHMDNITNSNVETFDSDHFSELDEMVNEHNSKEEEDDVGYPLHDTDSVGTSNTKQIYTSQGQKSALLIGINYIGNDETSDDLNGCVNDVDNIEIMLKEKCYFENNDITKLINQKASKENILKGLDSLVKFSHDNLNSQIWLSYSGHGGGKFSMSEDDMQSEFICPSDYFTSGLIHDDWLKDNFINKLHFSCMCFILMDCCNSGSNMNLPYSYSNKNVCDSNLAKIIKISGSRDDQTSADYFDRISSSYQGALTNKFLHSLKYTEEDTILTSYLTTKELLEISGFTQVPELCYTDSELVHYRLN